MAVSAFRETEPVGVTEQPSFLNGAVSVDTTLMPRELLDALLGVERQLGRVRDGTRWGPRTSISTCCSTATRWSTSRGFGFLTRVS